MPETAAAPSDKPYVSVGSQGRIIRLPHDGRLRVRDDAGGYTTAPVYSDRDQPMMRILARCIDCRSPYYFYGDVKSVGGQMHRRCPVCARARTNAAARARRADPAGAARNRAAQRRYLDSPLGRATRARHNAERRAARARRAAAAPRPACRTCAAPLPDTAPLNARYCSAACRRERDRKRNAAYRRANLAKARASRARAQHRRYWRDPVAARARNRAERARHPDRDRSYHLAYRAARHAQAYADRTCTVCSAPIHVAAHGHTRYCSDACRARARRAVKYPSTCRPRTCGVCRAPIDAATHGAVRYCSAACRRAAAAESLRAYRRRRRKSFFASPNYYESKRPGSANKRRRGRGYR